MQKPRSKRSEAVDFTALLWAKRFGMLVDRFGIPWMIYRTQAAERAAWVGAPGNAILLNGVT